MPVLDRLSQLDKFFVQQKLTILANLYDVSTLGEDGKSAGEPLVHVRQKKMKIREQIDVFEDENQQRLALRIQAKKVFEFRGRSEVQLADGTVIGQLQKVFGKSLWRSTWEIYDAPGERLLAMAHESSVAIAVLRRVWGMVPIVGDIPFFIPFHFDIFVNDHQVGRYTRLPALVDRYVMDLSGDPDKVFDRRVAVAFAIALDALQDR